MRDIQFYQSVITKCSHTFDHETDFSLMTCSNCSFALWKRYSNRFRVLLDTDWAPSLIITQLRSLVRNLILGLADVHTKIGNGMVGLAIYLIGFGHLGKLTICWNAGIANSLVICILFYHHMLPVITCSRESHLFPWPSLNDSVFLLCVPVCGISPYLLYAHYL